MDQFDPGNLTFGGAGGKATIDVVGAGDARGSANTQENGFQLGVNVDSKSVPFTVQTKIENLSPVSGLSVGVFIGTGDQDHYLSVAVTEGTNNTDDIYGFEVLTEDGPQNALSQKYDVPGVLGNSGVEVYINVNPAANTAQPYYSH